MSMLARGVRGIALALLLATGTVGPAAAKKTPAIAEDVDEMKPGQFRWQPELAPEGPVEIVISLGAQRAYVYRSGTLIGVSTISSGRPGYETPVGRFGILQKKKMHRSNRYESAPMPYMQRLNWFGVALHGGHVPGHPASHGCIRLPPQFAQKLYGVTSLGSFVWVDDREVHSAGKALELARANASTPLGPGRE